MTFPLRPTPPRLRRGGLALAAPVAPPPGGPGASQAPGAPVAPGTFDEAVLPRIAARFGLIAAFTRGVRWTPLLLSFFAYIWSITTYATPVGDIAMGAAVFALLFQREPLRTGRVAILLGSLTLWAAFGMVGSWYPDVVWKQLELVLKLVVIIVVAVNSLRSYAQIRFYIWFVLGAYLLYPVRGTLFNYVGGYTNFGRALWNHVYKNPNDLAALTMLQLSAAAGLVTIERHKLLRLGAFVSVGLLTLVVLLTQSRGAIIALTITLLVYFVGLTNRQRWRAALSVVALGVMLSGFVPASLWKRLSGLKNVNTQDMSQVDPEHSAEGRYDVWKVALRVIAADPVTGVGIGAYRYAHAEMAPRAGVLNDAAYGLRDAHSTYITALAETGVVGFGIYLVLLGSTFAHAERVRRRCRTLLPDQSIQIYYLELGLLAFALAGVFGTYWRLNAFYLHMALIWSLAEWCRTRVAAIEAGQAPLAVAPPRRTR
jgi:probable O-glycosylation ligase (exosortase A-associated)